MSTWEAMLACVLLNGSSTDENFGLQFLAQAQLASSMVVLPELSGRMLVPLS
jgi:hypothetical protein